MSIEVQLAHLREAIDQLDRPPYLLTVDDDGRPRSVAVEWHWHDDELVVVVGNRTLANASARTLVSLLWVPDEPGGYSLIVDGAVTRADSSGDSGNVVRVEPTRAVLHRPVPGPADPSSGSECKPVLDAG